MSKGKAVAVIGGWGAIAGIAVFGHPAVRWCSELGTMGRDLAKALQSQQAFAGYLAIFDRGALPAILALQLSLLYILLFALWKLARPAGGSGPARSAWVVGCAVAAQGVATVCAMHFGAAAFYAIGLGVFAAAAGVIAWKFPAPAEPAGKAPARSVTACVLAWVIPLAAIPADTVISSWVHAPPVPEGWFVAVVSWSDPGSRGWLVMLFLLVPVVAWLHESVSRPGESVAASVCRAPAAILMFGASNPLRGLLMVVALDRLARAGVPVWGRAMVMTAVVVTPALIYLRAG